jgi:hypothetical protein
MYHDSLFLHLATTSSTAFTQVSHVFLPTSAEQRDKVPGEVLDPSPGDTSDDICG